MKTLLACDCGATTSTTSAPGQSVACRGCAATLRVPLRQASARRELTCPACQELTSTLQPRGRRTSCERCGASFRVPLREAPAEEGRPAAPPRRLAFAERVPPTGQPVVPYGEAAPPPPAYGISLRHGDGFLEQLDLAHRGALVVGLLLVLSALAATELLDHRLGNQRYVFWAGLFGAFLVAGHLGSRAGVVPRRSRQRQPRRSTRTALPSTRSRGRGRSRS